MKGRRDLPVGAVAIEVATVVIGKRFKVCAPGREVGVKVNGIVSFAPEPETCAKTMAE